MTSRERFLKFFAENHMRIFKPGADGSLWEIWQAAERSAIERCLEKIEDERLTDDPEIWSDGGIGYNNALNHVSDALKELLND